MTDELSRRITAAHPPDDERSSPCSGSCFQKCPPDTVGMVAPERLVRCAASTPETHPTMADDGMETPVAGAWPPKTTPRCTTDDACEATPPGHLPATPPGFVLLDRALDHTPATLTTSRDFKGAPAWQGVEALAQTGAMHLRHITGFAMHVFLLGVTDCSLPDAPSLPCGPCRIEARLMAITQRAATYAITLHAPFFAAEDVETAPPCTSPPRAATMRTAPMRTALMRAEMLFGRVPYDTTFREAVLAPRYRDIFAWLTRS